MTPNAERLDRAKKLILWLAEKDNVGRELHRESVQCAEEGYFDKAIEACKTSLSLALQADDKYGRGAAWFYMGLHYFVLREGEWEIAAEYCLDAASAFHTVGAARGEGVAQFAIAHILAAACREGHDKWEAALAQAHLTKSFFDALAVSPPDDCKDARKFANRAHKHYARLSEEYAARLPTLHSFKPPTASTSPPAPTPDNGTAPQKKVSPDNGTIETSRRVHRVVRLPGHPFSPRLRRLFFLLTIATVVLLAILGVLQLFVLMQSQPIWGTGAAVLLGLLLGLLCLALAMLFKNQQLLVRGTPESAAVVLDVVEGRIWEYADGRQHLLIPFRDQLLGWIPLVKKDYTDFAPDLLKDPDRSTGARLTLKYSVVNPALVWDRLESKLQSRYKTWLYFPLPVDLDKSVDALEEYTHETASACLSEIARAVTQAQLADITMLRKQLLLALRARVAATGLFFNEIEIELYKRLT